MTDAGLFDVVIGYNRTAPEGIGLAVLSSLLSLTYWKGCGDGKEIGRQQERAERVWPTPCQVARVEHAQAQ